jgi:putative membrane protein
LKQLPIHFEPPTTRQMFRLPSFGRELLAFRQFQTNRWNRQMKEFFPMKMQTFASLSCSCILLAASAAALAQTSGDASAADKHFVHEALVGGMAEVQLGQLASQKGTAQDVKQFGQKMVEDHTKLGNQMKRVADQIGVTPPTALSPKDQALKTRLEGLSGAQFDRAYIQAMVKDHEKDLEAFQGEAANGSSQAVKDAAGQGATVVSHHLDMIKQIASTHHVMVNNAEAGTKSGQ